MEPRFDPAVPADIDELLQLYFAVYGKNYPLALGSDREVMTRMIASPHTLWRVARELDSGRIIGSAVIDTDPVHRIGKLEGVVVHPDWRAGRIAHRMIAEVTAEVLDGEGRVDSVYATTRTLSKSPKLMCLHNGFKALGIFPNAHKIQHHETLTLLARHREGILGRRHEIRRVPERLGPIVDVLRKVTGLSHEPEIIPETARAPRERRTAVPELEFIYAPAFVLKRSLETFREPAERFYPFHSPNLLISATDGSFEAYAYISKVDRYCTLIGFTPGLLDIAERLDPLIEQLTDFGASYIEVLLPIECYQEIGALLDRSFLPSAIYPAMRREGELWLDYIIMSRSMEPLDFRGMAIDSSFKPFVDQYVDLWKKMYLDTLEIFQ
jgi:hypothetical protein